MIIVYFTLTTMLLLKCALFLTLSSTFYPQPIRRRRWITANYRRAFAENLVGHSVQLSFAAYEPGAR